MESENEIKVFLRFFIFFFLLHLLSFNSSYSQVFNVSEVDKTNYPDVNVNFLTLKGDGSAFGDLTVNDFLVEENGDTIDPSTYRLECKNPPVKVVLVLDHSNSMNTDVEGEKRWDWVLYGVNSFINSIDLSDGESEVAMVSFAGRSQIRCPFTADKQELRDSLDKTYIINSSTNFNPPFLDDQSGAIELLKKCDPKFRRVVVFLSDGEHTIKPEKFDVNQVMKELKQWNIQSYNITLLNTENADLGVISNYSGGKYFNIQNKEKLADIYRIIADDAQNKDQCILSWISPPVCNYLGLYKQTKITFFITDQSHNRNYKAPDWGLARLDTDKDIYNLGNPDIGESGSQKIIITPKNYPFKINDIKVIPGEFFDVDWGQGFQESFNDTLELEKDTPYELNVKFTPSGVKQFRTAQVFIDADPCPQQVRVVGGISEIEVLKPSEGEILNLCEKVEIKWKGQKDNERVNLYYRYEDGEWVTIERTYRGYSYEWNPPFREGEYDIKVRLTSSFGLQDHSFDTSGRFKLEMPKLKVLKNTVDMGNCLTGDSSRKSVSGVLINDGRFPVNINKTSFYGEDPADFKLINALSDSLLLPGETLDLEIQYKPETNGFSEADLIFHTECIKDDTVSIFGKGVCAGEFVKIVDFGDIFIGRKDTIIKKHIFKNPTSEKYKIKPIIKNGKDLELFTIFKYINGNIAGTFLKSFEILPDSSITLAILFDARSLGRKEAYIDFSLPNECEPAITKLTANVVDAQLNAEGIAWGPKRKLTENDSSLTITNIGTITENINEIKLADPALNEIFKLEQKGNVNIPVEGGKTQKLDVSFKPAEERYYETELIILSDDRKDTLKLPLSGSGFLPKFAYEWSCGDMIEIGDSTDAELTLINPSQTSELKVDRIEITAGGEEFFKINNDLNGGYTMDVNSSEKIYFKFKPEEDLSHKIAITVYADNYDGEFTAEWKMNKISEGCDAYDIETDDINFGSVFLCDTNDNEVLIKNKAVNTDLILYRDQIFIYGKDKDDFYTEVNSDITVQPGETESIKVGFSPSDDVNYNKEAYLHIGNSFDMQLNIDLTGQAERARTYSSENKYTLKPGKRFTLPVFLNIPELEDESIEDLTLEVIYNNRFLHYAGNNLKSFTGENWQWSDPQIPDEGILRIRGEGILDVPFSGKVFEIDFRVLLDTADKSAIYATVDYECNSHDYLLTEVDYEDFCFNQGRRVIINNYAYATSVSAAAGNIELQVTIGLEAQTNISVYNTMGELVEEIEKKELPAGVHNYFIPAESIANGLYFIKVQSGPYLETKPVILNR